MSNQFQLDASLVLTPFGVEVVEAYHAIPPDPAVDAPERWTLLADRFPCVAGYVKDNHRADFIPWGSYADLVASSILVDGVWTIECSTGDKSDELEKFFEHIVPAIASHAEMSIEHEDPSIIVEYRLVDGKVKETERRDKYADDRPGWGYGR